MTAPKFVLVPVEPTEEMVQAAAAAIRQPRMRVANTRADELNTVCIGYRAMLSASPAAASAEGETRKYIEVTDLDDTAIKDIEAHISGKLPGDKTYDAPRLGWTCFHCGANFRTVEGARLHFGALPSPAPVCSPDQSAARIAELTTALEKIEAGAARGRPSDLEAAKLDLITILKIARDALAIPSTDRGG